MYFGSSINELTIWSSHWNHFLLHGIRHNHWLSCHPPNFFRVPSLCTKFMNILRYLFFKESFPNHLCVQNRILLPWPIFQPLSMSNQEFELLSHIFFISFNHQESNFEYASSSSSLHEPYLDSSTYFHKLISSLPSLHFHFPKSAILKSFIFFIPWSPVLWGYTTIPILPMQFSYYRFISPTKNLFLTFWSHSPLLWVF